MTRRRWKEEDRRQRQTTDRWKADDRRWMTRQKTKTDNRDRDRQKVEDSG
jgi:hypothetical protein